jgi:hypothetical protein
LRGQLEGKALNNQAIIAQDLDATAGFYAVRSIFGVLQLNFLRVLKAVRAIVAFDFYALPCLKLTKRDGLFRQVINARQRGDPKRDAMQRQIGLADRLDGAFQRNARLIVGASRK